MSDELKGIIIITNHFKEHPVFPKVVYANNYFLNSIGYLLEEIINKDPSEIFANWNNDEFIQEIVKCVDNKSSWCGELILKSKNGKNKARKFSITPIFTVDGEISYYSCSMKISNKTVCEINTACGLECLDKLVDTLSKHQEYYQNIYQINPENIIKIDTVGNVIFTNDQAKENLGIASGENLFKKCLEKHIKSEFKEKNIKGKVSKTEFSYILNKKTVFIKAHYWPIYSEENKLSGYSLNLVDISKKKNIKNELLALKGA